MKQLDQTEKKSVLVSTSMVYDYREFNEYIWMFGYVIRIKK
jgi:hypothetical protein